MAIAGTEKEITLIRDSFPIGAIWTPPNAPEGLMLGASELNHVFERMSNCHFRVCERTGEGKTKRPGIHLELDTSLRQGSCSINVNGAGVKIAGSDTQGLLNGVYTFLRTLGVRWFMPEEIGEEIPTRADVNIPIGQAIEQPAFEGRHVLSETEWGRRNRLGGPNVSGGQHWYEIMPTRQYFKKYPEYFALMKGRRTPNTWNLTQVCTSNPEVARVFAEYATNWFDHNPTGVLSLSPNDNENFCECDNCRRLDPDRKSRTDRVVEFLNRVAHIVAEKHPSRQISFLAYRSYSEPLIKHEIHSNLIPQLARFEGDLAYPLTPIGRRYIHEWRKTSECLATYEFIGHYSWFGFLPMVKALCEDFGFYKRQRVNIVSGEIHPHWATQGLNLWAAAELLWDSSLDAETLIDDYCSGMFHAAASHMKDFYWLLEEKVQCDRTKGIFETWNQLLFHDLEDCLSAAAKTADSIALQRIVLVMFGMEYTKAIVNARRVVDNAPNNALWQIEQALKVINTTGNKAFEWPLVLNNTTKLLNDIKTYANAD